MTSSTLTSPMTTAGINPQQAVEQLLNQLRASSGAPSSSSSAAASSVAATMISGVTDVLRKDPQLVTKARPKAFTAPAAVSAEVIGDKSFWDDLTSVVMTTVPVIVSALSKDYQPKAAVAIPPHLAQDKDFWDFLGNALNTVAPVLIGAITGKDYQPGQPPAVPPGKDKGWLDDAFKVVADVAPTVLPIVLSLL